ncbi:hypothetical protein RRG08_012289 [Elysia crispata]|uniref:Uncharacterized protein n=1 Tax=Elysia crispata TaxID=231223 RepID=A0AAE1BAX7_9GAST|nr:hypothetical protein RRG08_012289 [Elysia crispata]
MPLIYRNLISVSLFADVSVPVRARVLTMLLSWRIRPLTTACGSHMFSSRDNLRYECAKLTRYVGYHSVVDT